MANHPLFGSDREEPPVQIGEYAIADEAAGISISTQQRLDMALSDEPARVNHPLALTQHQAKKVTQNRIRSAMAELSHGNIDKVNEWLHEVGEKDPARAIELFMDLAQFTLPKLKAIAIDVKSTDGSVKTMTVAQLEAMVAQDASVVDTQ